MSKDVQQVLNVMVTSKNPSAEPGSFLQTMACDHLKSCRNFCGSNSSVQLVFHDIMEVATKDVAREGVSDIGTMRAVPMHQELWWSSFSCKGASIENASRAASLLNVGKWN